MLAAHLILLALTIGRTPASASPAVAPTGLQTGGGSAVWVFNDAVLNPLGIRIARDNIPSGRYISGKAGPYTSLQTHASLSSGLVAILDGDHLSGLHDGWIELHDGPTFNLPRVRLDLSHARIRPAALPSFALSISDDTTGKVWFTLDHPHFGRSHEGHTLWINHTDLHVGSALAETLGHPEWVGLVVGRVDLELPVVSEKKLESLAPVPHKMCPLDWPSVNRKVDLAMINLVNDPELGGLPDTIAYMRCGIAVGDGTYATCTPTSTQGLVVFAPDAALKNIGSAAIAWHPMLTGDQPPYGNDQHPYLFWNLYRIDAEGRIQQIGQSAAKHAYYADNFSCDCPHGLAAYPGCQETYAAGTNDMLAFLGPRSEIIPATGQWGRCGSVFDPKCLGRVNEGKPHRDDGYERRLAVSEMDLLPAKNPGAQYIFEYGYIVRDDIDLENSIARRVVTPAKEVGANGAIRWSLTPSSFDNGPAIGAWVDPQHPVAGAMTTRISTPQGHVRVAARTKLLKDGRYRYDYAVINEDFAHAVTEGAEPNLRIRSANGFNRFSVSLPRGLDVTDVSFTDADRTDGNNWTRETGTTSIDWVAPAGNPLNWGTLYSFGFTTARVPVEGLVSLGIAQANDSAAISASSLVPQRSKQAGVRDAAGTTTHSALETLTRSH